MTAIFDQEMQKVMISVDEEWLRQAVFVCEIAIENSAECLANNRHHRLVPLYEKDLEYAKKLRTLLREKLGWPAIVNEWVPAKPIDAIQDPPLRCRVKENDDSDWAYSTLVGYDRSDEYKWACADPQIQWAKHCEVWK
jgi:hypothetical protein